MKQQLLKGKTEELILRVYDKGIQLIPTSAKITLLTNENLDFPSSIENVGVTPEADGTMKYTISTTNTANLKMNAKAIWEYVVNGKTYYRTQLFDIVYNVLDILITDTDLIDELNALQEYGYRVTGKVTEGSSKSEFIDNINLTVFTKDYFKNGYAEFISGILKEQRRKVISFDETTYKVKVSPDLSTKPSINDKYIIQKSYQTEINRAFDKIINYINNQGYRPALVSNSEELKEVHIHKTIEMICQNNSKNTDDIWWGRYEDYGKKANHLLKTLNLSYDGDELNTVSARGGINIISAKR